MRELDWAVSSLTGSLQSELASQVRTAFIRKTLALTIVQVEWELVLGAEAELTNQTAWGNFSSTSHVTGNG